MSEQLELWIEGGEVDPNICFVCGKIFVKGETIQELTKSDQFVGNICSKKCVDYYWKWWHKEYRRLFNADT